jgi:hypothetical protein
MGVLALSFLLESGSGIVALRVAMGHARERNIGLVQHLRHRGHRHLRYNPRLASSAIWP